MEVNGFLLSNYWENLFKKFHPFQTFSAIFFKFKQDFDNLTTNGPSKKYVLLLCFIHVQYVFFSLHLCSLLSATTDQVNKAKDVIKKLTIGFDSSQFENPCKISHFVQSSDNKFKIMNLKQFTTLRSYSQSEGGQGLGVGGGEPGIKGVGML